MFNIFVKPTIGGIAGNLAKPLLKQFNMSSIGGMSDLMLKIGLKYLNSSTAHNRKFEEELILEDYYLKSATYLKDIPIVFGEMMLLCNVIWSTCVDTKEYIRCIEESNFNHYNKYRTYTVSFAVAVCKGEVDEISEIYFNDKPIDTSVLDLRIYKGSESQIPDSLIASKLGQNATPAFRDLCYIVVQDLDLREFNYKIPQVKCMVKKSDSGNFNYGLILQQVADHIEHSALAESDLHIDLRGLMLNRRCRFSQVLERLNLRIILQDLTISCQHSDYKKDAERIFEIADHWIVPIDGMKFLVQNANNSLHDNIRISYLNSKDFRLKNYINEFDSTRKLETITLPFAISDEDVKTIYEGYRLNTQKSSNLFVIQAIASEVNIGIGQFVQVSYETKLVLKVIKRIFHTNNVITLFCVRG